MSTYFPTVPIQATVLARADHVPVEAHGLQLGEISIVTLRVDSAPDGSSSFPVQTDSVIVATLKTGFQPPLVPPAFDVGDPVLAFYRHSRTPSQCPQYAACYADCTASIDYSAPSIPDCPSICRTDTYPSCSMLEDGTLVEYGEVMIAIESAGVLDFGSDSLGEFHIPEGELASLGDWSCNERFPPVRPLSEPCYHPPASP